MKTGAADLPLHPGRAPAWLFKRMVPLSKAIADAIIIEYSQEELLARISNPYWFQALACALGFDWHSSGTTTTTCGALKLALSADEHGVIVAGGKGKASRKTPQEILASPFPFSEARRQEFVQASRMAAKIDNNLIQDGFQLYHHCFFLTEKGAWAVVQQGMDAATARRYHWLSGAFGSFVCEPHSAICCDATKDRALDLTAKESGEARKTSLDLVKDDPARLRKYFGGAQAALASFSDGYAEASFPARHEITRLDLTEKGWRALKNAFEFQPKNYEELVALHGIGAKSLRALALLSDLLYGAKASWKDPVKYSFAHGGKDGIPYPVDRENYDDSIRFLEDCVKNAGIRETDKLGALKRLHALTWREQSPETATPALAATPAQARKPAIPRPPLPATPLPRLY